MMASEHSHLVAEREPGQWLPDRAPAWSDGLQVRQRRDGDRAAIFAILRQESFVRNGCTLDPFNTIDDFDAFDSALAPDRMELVATLDDRVIGFVGVYILPGRQKHVGSFTLAVHDDYQGLGIGTLLMNVTVTAAFLIKGLRRIQAIVFADNPRALALYERLGFVVEGRLSRFARRESGFVDGYLIARLGPDDVN